MNQHPCRARLTGLLIAATVVVVGGCTPPTTTPPTITTPPANVVFHEDFSAPELDATRWVAYHNDYGSANAELQCNTPDNVAVSSGALRITSRAGSYSCPSGGTKSYTSGFLGSRDAGRYYPLYGRYEARMRLPHGQGVWPAFWLRHRNGSSTAEVDVMEYFHSQVPGKASQTLHLPATKGYNIAKKASFFEPATPGTGGWHTYAVDIRPAPAGAIVFTFQVDGVTQLTYTDTTPTWATWAPADASWDIALNVAVGGKYAGDPRTQLGYLPLVGKCSLTYAAPANGDPSACPTTGIFLPTLPSVTEVDWVRVTR